MTPELYDAFVKQAFLTKLAGMTKQAGPGDFAMRMFGGGRSMQAAGRALAGEAAQAGRGIVGESGRFMRQPELSRHFQRAMSVKSPDTAITRGNIAGQIRQMRSTRPLVPQPGKMWFQNGGYMGRTSNGIPTAPGAKMPGMGNVPASNPQVYQAPKGVPTKPGAKMPGMGNVTKNPAVAPTIVPEAEPSLGALGSDKAGPMLSNAPKPWNWRNFDPKQPGQYISDSPIGQTWNRMSPNQRFGAGAAGLYGTHQLGENRGRRQMVDTYNNMGYLPKLLTAITGRDIPQPSLFSPF